MSLGSLLHGGRVTTPEQHLVFAILAMAVVDLFGRASSDPGGALRREAMAFLTASNGPWAQRRREECEYVSIDADELRRRVIAILEGKTALYQVTEKSLQGVAEARALWASQKPVPSPLPRRVKPTPVVQAPIPKIKPPPVERPTPDPFNEAAVEADRRDLRAKIMQCLAKRPMTKKELYEVTKPAKATAVAAHLYHAERQGHIELRGYHYEVRVSNDDATPQLSVATNSG